MKPRAAGCSDFTGRWTPSAPSWVRFSVWSDTSCSIIKSRHCCGWRWRTAVLVAFGVVNFPDALLLLRLNEIGFSVVEVILAYVGYNAVYAVSSYPAGLLADRIPRPAVFGVGLVFFAVGYVGLGLTTDAVAAWLLIGVYGLFTGCTDGVGTAWISSLIGSDLQGSAQGVFQGFSGFAVLAAGVVGRVPVGR
jgi:MFS family permease